MLGSQGGAQGQRRPAAGKEVEEDLGAGPHTLKREVANGWGRGREAHPGMAFQNVPGCECKAQAAGCCETQHAVPTLGTLTHMG